MKHNQDGYGYVALAVGLFIVAAVIAIIGYLTVLFGEPSTKVVINNEVELTEVATEEKIACELKPVLPIPVDKTFIKSVLYPGQVRGGNYKPHGGFVLNTPSTRATVYLPVNARPIAAARYYEQGEIQYMIDFETECKIRLRFDHLAELSPYLQDIIEKLPAPIEGDSRTTTIMGKDMKAGDSIATKVGFEKNNNVFLDFGLYDFNQKNKSSQDPTWAAAHQFENDQYAVCWIDYLSVDDATLIRSLPATDQISGKTSDYCK